MKRSSMVQTSHAPIRVEQAGNGDKVVLLIHGNSMSLEVFAEQMAVLPTRGYRVVAFDLPGHGGSGNATDPARSYTLPGYADLAKELLALLGIADPVILGWSLGGHIALEMMAYTPLARGLVLVGTPPVGMHDFRQAFRPSPHMRLVAQRRWSSADIEQVAQMFGKALPPSLRQSLVRADGLARTILFEGRDAGLGVDQRRLVERLPTPVAIINGADDPMINLDYLDAVGFGNLWGGRCVRIPGAGHAPFLETPAVFNAILDAFLDDLGAATEWSGSSRRCRTTPARTATRLQTRGR